MQRSDWVQLISDLRNEDDIDRAAEACEKIAQVADESHVADLYALLQDANFFVREAVTVPLARLEGLKALPALFHALTRGFNEGCDNDSLSSTIADLLEDNQAAAAPILLDMLTAAESETRANAAWALGFVAEEITADPLLAALSDTDAGVRSDAAGSLASFGSDPRVIEALLRALSDSNEQVRISAASSLGYLGDPRAIEPLKALLKITSRKFRPVVKDALERLGQS